MPTCTLTPLALAGMVIAAKAVRITIVAMRDVAIVLMFMFFSFVVIRELLRASVRISVPHIHEIKSHVYGKTSPHNTTTRRSRDGIRSRGDDYFAVRV